MTRRGFLALPGLFLRPSPHDQVVAEGNAFNSLFVKWANAFNRCTKGNLDAGEVTAWEPMPKQFRALEHARREWIRNF